MNYMICIDSGGTKTDTVLFDQTGRVYTRKLSNGANGLDVGMGESARRILAAIESAAECVPTANADGGITAIYGGIAGVHHLGNYLYDYIAPKFPAQSLRIDDDGINLISGTLGHADGCGMVAGTGSSLFARIAGKPLVHIGGKGYLIDTGGSGFVMGQEALRMAHRALDGRGEPTMLVDMLARELGDDIRRCMDKIYRGGRPFIASLAHNVFEARRLGDSVAGQIYDAGVRSLADMTLAAERHFEGEFSIVMGGGLFAAFPEYAVSVRECGSSRAVMIRAEVPPVYGAAVEAMYDAGHEPDDKFKTRFLEGYYAASVSAE